MKVRPIFISAAITLIERLTARGDRPRRSQKTYEVESRAIPAPVIVWYLSLGILLIILVGGGHYSQPVIGEELFAHFAEFDEPEEGR